MKLVEVYIKNYKSIGKTENCLKIDSEVTAIIGKNESGKSNVLEAIGNIDTLLKLPQNYLDSITRNQNDQVEIELKFVFEDTEKNADGIGNEATVLKYTKSAVIIEGGLKARIMTDNDRIQDVDDVLCDLKEKKYAISNTMLSQVSNIVKSVRLLENHVKFEQYINLKKIVLELNKLEFDNKDELLCRLKMIENKIKKYYSIIPDFYFRKGDRILKERYTREEIFKDHLGQKNTLLHNMFMVAKIDKSTIKSAFDGKTSGEKKTAKKCIIDNINTNIVDKFNKFYTQETIQFDIDYEMNEMVFFVMTGTKAMTFTERSNGLKWYFSLFIDILARESDRCTIYLFDEPGVHLHVNAQKELLHLFSNLCKNKGQVIYTTHSPFMIDSENITNVRAVEKNTEGISLIMNSIYHSKKSGSMCLETLTPLIEALGMQIKYNIGPSIQNTNLVVEGITDYIYLTTMVDYFQEEIIEEFNIIPSIGVDNVNSIVSILKGWGCNFKVILDYDYQGYSECEKLVKKLDLKLEEDVFYINCKVPSNKNDVQGNKKETIESLIDIKDTSKISYFSKDKKLAALEFRDKIKNGEIRISRETEQNFRRLLINLGIIVIS